MASGSPSQASWGKSVLWLVPAALVACEVVAIPAHCLLHPIPACPVLLTFPPGTWPSWPSWTEASKFPANLERFKNLLELAYLATPYNGLTYK